MSDERAHNRSNQIRHFEYFSWGVLGFVILVIVWGALVRATGSGAGCGSHWPLCNGALLPEIPHHTTFIEFFHRVTSGLALLLVVGQLVWCRRLSSKGSPLRQMAWLALFFMIIESLLGAGLVVFELVADNDSVARAVWMALHLGNTFLLLSPLALLAWWASGRPTPRATSDRLLVLLLTGGLLGTLLVGMTGAIAALGDTLFPATSISEGLRQDFNANAHFLIRLRVLHPIVAIGMTVYLMAIAWTVQHYVGSPLTQRLAYIVMLLFGFQLAVGALNVVLMAPVWMQMFHLVMAVIIWICMVLMTVEALVASTQSVPLQRSVSRPAAG